MYFNALNDDGLLQTLRSKAVLGQLRDKFEAGSFLLLTSTEPFDPLLEGEGVISEPRKRFPNRFDLGRVASYHMPGWDLVTRWRETAESSRGAMTGYVQVYRKKLSKGEYSEAELLEMIESQCGSGGEDGSR